MKINKYLADLTTRALSETMDTRSMTHLARDIINSSYNLHERIGLPESLPIANRLAASQIVQDILESGLFFPLIDTLINIHYNGYMGKTYSIPLLKEIIHFISEQGFIFDRENRIFVEDPRIRRTMNWGTLQDGEEYILSFLQIDIVGNSELVRKYPKELIKQSYREIRKIVNVAVERRNGRIWSIDGDGMLIAFYFGNKHLKATLSAMEILHEMFIYNLTKCPLEKPIGLKLAVHSGSFEFTSNIEEMKNSETLKKTKEIESEICRPGSVIISNVVEVMLDEVISSQFVPLQNRSLADYYSYELKWEN